MCAKVVILPDSANSFPFFLMSVKVEITWRRARLKSKVNLFRMDTQKLIIGA